MDISKEEFCSIPNTNIQFNNFDFFVGDIISNIFSR